MLKRLLPLLLSLYLLLAPNLLFAAHVAAVEENGVAFYAFPNQESEVLERLNKFTFVYVSNYPISGFYKAKTTAGKIGWIAVNDVKLRPSRTPSAEATAQESADGELESSEHAVKIKRAESLSLRLFSDFNLFNDSGVVNNYGSLGNAFGFGGELVAPFGKSWSLVFRLESIAKSFVFSDTSTGNTFQVSIGSIPVLLGPEWILVNGPRGALFFSMLGGAGLQTQIHVVSSGNDLPFSSTAFTALAKLSLLYHVSQSVLIFAEGGYRYLQASPMSIAIPSGSSFILPSTFTLNYSGPFLGLGVGYQF